MAYSKKLPTAAEIRSLATHAVFPATTIALRGTARRARLAQETIDFLALFPDDERFPTRDDFLTRSEELVFLIEQERSTPAEIIHTPL